MNMYLKHYNLTLKPFEISPDPKFLWLGEKHKQALAAMKNGILENKGFISLTGDVGTGKTTLVNALANILGDNIIFALVPDPSLAQLDLLNLSEDALKINKKFSTKGDFLSHLRHFLNHVYVHRKEVVLVFEEAQKFDPERLEEVRLLLNLQPDKQLINIVFVGQNEFNHILKKNKPLRREFSIIHEIEPLPELETEHYVMHRLKIAGSEKKIFSPEAVREIYSFSEGNPRLINIICDSALSTGYAKELKIIEAGLIRECAANCILPEQPKRDGIEDLNASATSIPETETGVQSVTSGSSYQKVAKKGRIKPAGLKLAYVTSMFVVILLSISGYLYFFGENYAPYRNLKTFLGQAFDRMTGSESQPSFQHPDEINIRQGDMAEPKVQVMDLKTQKASTEISPGQSRSSDDEPVADPKALKNANARVDELESVAALRKQMLLKLREELDREKKNRELLSSELSSKVDLIAELQEKLENSQPNSMAFEADLEDSKIKINELQEQLLKVKAERASVETQLDQLRSHNAGLTADNQELKSFKERVVALESELATGEQSLSRPDQQLSRLAKELSQEKKSRELLNSELSSKEVTIARLQEELELSQSNALEFEAEIENRIIQIRELEGQLLNLKLEMSSPETQLGQLRSRNEELTAGLEELKGTKELVAGLESELAERDQTISFLEQRLSQITKELDQERKNRELLSSELSKKSEMVSEFQQKLQTSQSNQVELEKTIKNGEKEIAEIQNQLRSLKARQTATEPSAVIDDVKEKSTSKIEASGEQDESPKPSNIIDYVLKKKAK